jgi:hypothetical protein
MPQANTENPKLRGAWQAPRLRVFGKMTKLTAGGSNIERENSSGNPWWKGRP